MDVSDPLKKLYIEETSRKHLALASRNDGGIRRSQTREGSSRYMSPTPSTSRRFPSPSINKTLNPTSQMAPKRATTAERKRPSTPSSPKRPSTPVNGTSVDIHVASRKESVIRVPELLWPSTMRSLSVSFQSDNDSAPTTKNEKPVTPSISNCALRPSSNVTQKTHVTSRRPTPERKGVILKGNHSENYIPCEGLDVHLVGQYGLSSRISGKKSASTRTRAAKPTVPLNSGTRSSCYLKDNIIRDLQRSSSDTASLVSFEYLESLELASHSKLPLSSHSIKQSRPVTPASPKKSLPAQSFPKGLSPSRQRIYNSTPSRGVSPTPVHSRGFSLTPVPSRCVSPSRIRPSSPTRQESTSSSTSVLSFTPYIRKGKNLANHLEDVHQLRLFYNSYLQWRYANAQTDATLQRQKAKVEKTLHNVSNVMVKLWESVIQKRYELQQLRMKLVLYSILKAQIVFLDDWASIERNYTCSLSWAIEDLESCILCVPFTAGARGQTETVSKTIYFALNVIQTMGSSIYSTLSRVDGMTYLITELATIATQERLMLDECGSLLTAITAMQVKENSLRTHLIQLKESLRDAGSGR